MKKLSCTCSKDAHVSRRTTPIGVALKKNREHAIRIRGPRQKKKRTGYSDENDNYRYPFDCLVRLHLTGVLYPRYPERASIDQSQRNAWNVQSLSSYGLERDITSRQQSAFHPADPNPNDYFERDWPLVREVKTRGFLGFIRSGF